MFISNIHHQVELVSDTSINQKNPSQKENNLQGPDRKPNTRSFGLIFHTIYVEKWNSTCFFKREKTTDIFEGNIHVGGTHGS